MHQGQLLEELAAELHNLCGGETRPATLTMRQLFLF